MDEHSRMERMLAWTEPHEVYVSRHHHHDVKGVYPLVRSQIISDTVIIDYCDQGLCGVEILDSVSVEVDGECFHPEHKPGHHE